MFEGAPEESIQQRRSDREIHGFGRPSARLGSSETDRGNGVEHQTRRRCVVAGEAQCENGVKAVSDALGDPLMCDALSERVKETSRFDPVSVSSTVVAYSCDLSAGLRSIP